MESARADQSADRARLGGGENLLVYTAEPGSETAERLRLLAVVGSAVGRA
jgi:hypothetical protein